MSTWRGLLEDAGWMLDEAEEFYEAPNLRDESERYVLVVAIRHRH